MSIYCNHNVARVQTRDLWHGSRVTPGLRGKFNPAKLNGYATRYKCLQIVTSLLLLQIKIYEVKDDDICNLTQGHPETISLN